MQNDLNKPNRQNVINPRNNNQKALLLKTLVETDNLYISSLRKRGGEKKKDLKSNLLQIGKGKK